VARRASEARSATAKRKPARRAVKAAPKKVVDPIFAAIKRERDAYAAYRVTQKAQSRISAQDPYPPKLVKGRAPSARSNAKRMAHPAWKAWWARYQEAEEVHRSSCEELWSAREAFLRTQPTSFAGLQGCERSSITSKALLAAEQLAMRSGMTKNGSSYSRPSPPRSASWSGGA